MKTSDFLARLEDYLTRRLLALDIQEHPSSDAPRRLTRQWTIDFVANEAARHEKFSNLAALLRNVSESGPKFGH